jgi:hypothetical protein
MSWINKYKKVWRLAALLLLLAAIIGPWFFENLAIPSKYDCPGSNVRLRENICGAPMSGIVLFTYVLSGFPGIVIGFVQGTLSLADRGRELLFTTIFTLGGLMLLLPIYTTLRSLQDRQNQRRKIINILAWGMAVSLGLLWPVSSYSGHYWVLWGSWLYIAVAASTLALELLTLITERKISPGKL